MLKGGVIMDVVTPEQAKIAEDAGACAVMALERVPADIRAQGGVARMSDPDLIEGIIEAVSIPVMAKAGSATSSRLKCSSPSGWTLSMSRKCLARLTTPITSISGPLASPSCVGRRTWVRLCAASPRALR
ncbi:pyridoxine biosynthesis glutamine amidotransferase [Cutibacterium acnes JCM 18918]|nr:pyridoxine biosynthesis glutamine amidotransferase [Cutibacterium acnes JCM 18918]